MKSSDCSPFYVTWTYQNPLKEQFPAFCHPSASPVVLAMKLLLQMWRIDRQKILSRFEHEQQRMLMYSRLARVCTRIYACSDQNRVGEDIEFY